RTWEATCANWLPEIRATTVWPWSSVSCTPTMPSDSRRNVAVWAGLVVTSACDTGDLLLHLPQRERQVVIQAPDATERLALGPCRGVLGQVVRHVPGGVGVDVVVLDHPHPQLTPVAGNPVDAGLPGGPAQVGQVSALHVLPQQVERQHTQRGDAL